MPSLKRNNASPIVHSSGDTSAARAFKLDRIWQTNQWLVLVLGIFMLSTIVFAYHSFAASTGNHRNPYGVVDSPTSTSGVITFTGWAVDTQLYREGGISSVQFYIDKVDNQHYYGGTKLKINRAYICSQFKTGRVGCPNIGWSRNIDTLRHHIPDGNHIIFAKIIDQDKDLHYFLASKLFKVDNAHASSPANDPPYVSIQGVSQVGTIDSLNKLYVYGFAVDSQTRPETGVIKVAIFVDGALVGDAIYGHTYQAACDTIGVRPDCPNVGFELSFNGSSLSTGTHLLSAVAYDTTGKSNQALQNFKFTAFKPSDPRSETDRKPDFPKGGNLVHYIYMVPFGGDDRQLDKYPTIKNSIAAQQQWLRVQTGGRTIRVDTYNGGEPDITFFQAKNPKFTKAYYKSLGRNIWETINNQIIGAGFNEPDKKYVVILDGGSESACGITSPSTQTALVELDGTYAGSSFQCSAQNFSIDPSAPGFLDFTALHELVHTLGQTPVCAKNNNPKNPYHVIDNNIPANIDDLMWGSVFDSTERVLDFKKNDYYFINGNTGCVADTLNVSPFLN